MSQILYDRPPGQVTTTVQFPAMVLDTTREAVGGGVRYRMTLYAYLGDAPQLVESAWYPTSGDAVPVRGVTYQVGGRLASVNGHLGMIVDSMLSVDSSSRSAIVMDSSKKGQ